MATNFHSDLPNDQIHNPKDFSVAKNSSVPVKTHNGSLDWLATPYSISTTLTCIADVAGALHNSFFHVFFNKGLFFEIHFAVVGDSTAFVPTAGYTQETVSINPNATAIEVALAINVKLQAIAIATFVSSVNGTGKCTFSGMTDSNDTVDMGTGFLFANTRTSTSTDTVLTSTSGILSWAASSGGGGAVSSLTVTGTGAATLNSGVLNVPTPVIPSVPFTSLTTSGTSGAATLSSGVLNIPTPGANATRSSTTWNGCINITESGRSASSYGYPLACIDRNNDSMSVNFGVTGTSMASVPVTKIIPGTKVNVTTNGMNNFSFTGKVMANAASVGGFLYLYKATLTCSGAQPTTYTMTLIKTITIPALNTGAFYCFSDKTAFSNVISLNDGDLIVPQFSGQNGLNTLYYTSTLELLYA